MILLHPLLTKSRSHCSLEGQGTQPQSKEQLHRDKLSTLLLQVLLLGTTAGTHLQTIYDCVRHVHIRL